MSLLSQSQREIQRIRDRLNLRRDYQEVFGTTHGQRVLADILAKAGVTVPRFHADPGITQFNEGARHLASSIFRQVHGSTDKLPALMGEEIRKLESNQEQEQT